MLSIAQALSFGQQTLGQALAHFHAAAADDVGSMSDGVGGVFLVAESDVAEASTDVRGRVHHHHAMLHRPEGREMAFEFGLVARTGQTAHEDLLLAHVDVLHLKRGRSKWVIS